MNFIAPAKINLNLSIVGRRTDGYHFIQSDMVFTTWGDEITMAPSDQFTLTADGPYSNVFTGELLSTNRGSSNLIVKAIYMMVDHANKNPDFHIHVTKNIPAGAGLGGGSSDAAMVMHALNDQWNLNLSMDELCAMGLNLGAELPVCLHAPNPCHVSGIGDVIEPINIKPLNLLIVWPDTSLMTKDVFDVYDGEQHKVNDLIGAAVSLCPDVGDIITKLQAIQGCQNAAMSGSGSACFGIFETVEQAESAKSQFKNAIVTVTI